MRRQVITRVVDARETQNRVILWLACKHTRTVSEFVYSALHVGEEVDCMFCPDPPPPEKSAHQLWKEAGEP